MDKELEKKHWMIRNFPVYLRKKIRLEALKKDQTISEYVAGAVKRGMEKDEILQA